MASCIDCGTSLEGAHPNRKRCDSCRVKARRKGNRIRNARYRSNPLVKERLWETEKKRRQRPEVKRRIKELRSTPEQKQKDKAYHQKRFAEDPKLARKKARERQREYRARNRDKIKAADQEYKSRPEVRNRAAERARERWATDAEWRALKILRNRTRTPWNDTVTPKAILDLFDKQSGTCVLCGTSIQSGYHLDHIHPASKGGPSTLGNLQLLCPPCNLKKGNRV